MSKMVKDAREYRIAKEMLSMAQALCFYNEVIEQNRNDIHGSVKTMGLLTNALSMSKSKLQKFKEWLKIPHPDHYRALEKIEEQMEKDVKEASS